MSLMLKLGAPVGGAVVGAMAGGPIGLGVGVAAGGLLAWWRGRSAAPVVPVGSGVFVPATVAPAAPPAVPLGAALTLMYAARGQMIKEATPYTPSSAALTNDISTALKLAGIGHGPSKEGEAWVARAKVDGAGAAELAQLRAAGYSV